MNPHSLKKLRRKSAKASWQSYDYWLKSYLSRNLRRDRLTDLPNENAFMEDMKFTLDRRQRSGIYLFHVDNFIHMVGRFGQDAGLYWVQHLRDFLVNYFGESVCLGAMGPNLFVVHVYDQADLDDDRMNEIFAEFKPSFRHKPLPLSIRGVYVKGGLAEESYFTMFRAKNRLARQREIWQKKGTCPTVSLISDYMPEDHHDDPAAKAAMEQEKEKKVKYAI